MCGRGSARLDWVRDFFERHRSFQAAKDAYAAELQALDQEIAVLESRRDALAAAGALFADPVTLDWGQMQWVAEILRELGLAEERAPASEVRPRKVPSQKTNSYTHATIAKAVKLVHERNSGSDVTAGAKLSSAHDGRRVKLMVEGGLFRLNAKGKLWVDGRVRRDGRRIVLRYWDANGELRDPRDFPPSRQGFAG